jgi:hypothetical protein
MAITETHGSSTVFQVHGHARRLLCVTCIECALVLPALTLCVALSPAMAGDGRNGDCPSTPQEQVESFADDRASGSHWPLIRVSVDRRSNLDIRKVVDAMAVVTIDPSTRTPKIHRLGSDPKDRSIAGEYVAQIERLVQGKAAFSVRVRWEFAGLPAFNTIAVFIPPGDGDRHLRLLFEPVLDVSGTDWKRGAWRAHVHRMWLQGCTHYDLPTEYRKSE